MRQAKSILALLLLVTSAAAWPLAAGGPQGPRQVRGFLVRLGGFFPEGDSDFWRDNATLFTFEASDFDDATIGLSGSWAFNRYVEVEINADFYDQVVTAGYRDYGDTNGFPILHDTALEMIPVTLGVRLLPFGRHMAGPRGRNRPVLFLGAGAGANFWDYREVGDFIDFSDPLNPVVFGAFEESDVSVAFYGAAGIELPLSPNFNLSFEGRYFSSDAELQGDFAGLGTLDMSGLGLYVGTNWRF